MKMKNQERLNKLEQAISLIRKVEFSYEQGSEERKLLYKFVVDNFSLTGRFVDLIEGLKYAIEQERTDALKED